MTACQAAVLTTSSVRVGCGTRPNCARAWQRFTADAPGRGPLGGGLGLRRTPARKWGSSAGVAMTSVRRVLTHIVEYVYCQLRGMLCAPVARHLIRTHYHADQKRSDDD